MTSKLQAACDAAHWERPARFVRPRRMCVDEVGQVPVKAIRPHVRCNFVTSSCVSASGCPAAARESVSSREARRFERDVSCRVSRSRGFDRGRRRDSDAPVDLEARNLQR